MNVMVDLLVVGVEICKFFFFFQAEDGIRDHCVTGVQTCALPKRPLSQSHPSSTSWLSRARTRLTPSSRTVKRTLHCDGHSVQIEPASSMSHGRARKR